MNTSNEMVLVHSSDVVWVPEESLSHFGVKGMRWGKRSASSSDSSSGSEGSAKPISKSKQRTQNIKDARGRMEEVTRKAYAAEDKYNSAKTDRARKTAEKALLSAADDYTSTVLTSMQRTRGEKLVAGIALGISATAVLGPTAVSIVRR